MDALRLTASNHLNRRLETKVETSVSMTVAPIGPLAAHLENNWSLPSQFTGRETESDKSSCRRRHRNRRLRSNHRRNMRSSYGELLTVIQSVNAYLETSLDYCPYPLAERSQWYNDDVVRLKTKLAKRLEVQLKSQMFARSNLITNLNFLPEFQMACDTNGINKGAGMSLFHFLRKKLPVRPSV